jgi:hypothetical protein
MASSPDRGDGAPEHGKPSRGLGRGLPFLRYGVGGWAERGRPSIQEQFFELSCHVSARSPGGVIVISKLNSSPWMRWATRRCVLALPISDCSFRRAKSRRPRRSAPFGQMAIAPASTMSPRRTRPEALNRRPRADKIAL